MPLGLSVALLVLGGIIAAGVVGYLIDKSREAADSSEERKQSR